MLGAWPPPSAALSQFFPAQWLGHTIVPEDLESWLLPYLLAKLSKYLKQTNYHFPWPADNISPTSLHLFARNIISIHCSKASLLFLIHLPCTYNSKSNHQMAGNVAHTPRHCTEHYPGEWSASLMAAMLPRKNWARHRTHFQNNFKDTWSKENGIEEVYQIFLSWISL